MEPVDHRALLSSALRLQLRHECFPRRIAAAPGSRTGEAGPGWRSALVPDPANSRSHGAKRTPFRIGGLG